MLVNLVISFKSRTGVKPMLTMLDYEIIGESLCENYELGDGSTVHIGEPETIQQHNVIRWDVVTPQNEHDYVVVPIKVLDPQGVVVDGGYICYSVSGNNDNDFSVLG